LRVSSSEIDYVRELTESEDKPKHEVEVAPTLKAAVQPALAKVSPTGYQANRYVVDEDPFLSDDE
jgi:hypothetical protein